MNTMPRQMPYALLRSILIFLLLIANTSYAQTVSTPELVHSLDLETTSLENPGNIQALVFSPWKELFALEDEGQRILQIDEHGKLINHTGGFGYGEGTTRGATDIQIVGFEIWVADPQAGHIVRFDRWLTPLPPFTGYTDGSRTVELERPVSVDRSPNGDIVVLERDLQELIVMDPEGRLVERLAGFGDHDRSLVDPKRVEISTEGLIAICDPGSHSVVLLDQFGTLIRNVQQHFSHNAPTGMSFAENLLWVTYGRRLSLFADDGNKIMTLQPEGTQETVQDVASNGSNLVAVAMGKKILVYSVEQQRLH